MTKKKVNKQSELTEATETNPVAIPGVANVVARLKGLRDRLTANGSLGEEDQATLGDAITDLELMAEPDDAPDGNGDPAEENRPGDGGKDDDVA